MKLAVGLLVALLVAQQALIVTWLARASPAPAHRDESLAPVAATTEPARAEKSAFAGAIVRQCGAGVPSARAECGESLECLRRHLEAYEHKAQLDVLRTTMCLSSARRCPANASVVLGRTGECGARLFDRDSDEVDIVMPWTNLSESGYYTRVGDSFFRSLEQLRQAYVNTSSRRPPFSEVVFALRSLDKWGLLQRARRVFILYDDDLHGPPSFVADGQDRVVPLPASLLFAGSPFVRRRRRLHATLSRLHRIPGLSDFVIFVPDDCLMMRRLKWEDFVSAETGRILSRLAPMSANKPLNRFLQQLMQRHFAVPFFQVGTDLHAPFMIKRCYLEEMEARFCDELYQCDEDVARRDVCDFSSFHFQLFAQNYQAMREGHAITRPRAEDGVEMDQK